MKAWAILRQLLAVLAMVGLAAAPIAAASGLGVARPAPMMMDMGDMDCCPPAEPAPACPKSCPLMVVCMAKCFHTAAAPGHAVAIAPEPTAIVVYCDDVAPDRLADAPIPRPPKSQLAHRRG